MATFLNYNYKIFCFVVVSEICAIRLLRVVSHCPLVVIICIVSSMGVGGGGVSTEEITVHNYNMNWDCSSGLLQFQRPQHPLSNGSMRVEEDSEYENKDDQRHRREGEMMAGTHSSVEEQIFEHLPPQLHRGIQTTHSTCGIASYKYFRNMNLSLSLFL